MTEEKYQLLISKYEKLEIILNKMSAENEKITDSFSTSNGKLLTASVEESIHFMKKILEDHRIHFLTELNNDNEELFNFLCNEE